MAENKISYIARTYDDYKNEIKELTRKYYPDVFYSLNDASIGEWLIELVSDVGDNLSYHTDRVFQETNIDSANEMSSLLSLARTHGLKIPGPKAAIVEVELSCEIPLNDSGEANSDGRLSTADENYCPYIRKGTQFSTGFVTFELDENVDFKEQFNSEGYSNRQIIPNRDSNGNIQSYTYKKTSIAVAAQSQIYKMTVQSTDIEPFMSITLTDKNVIGVESIIVRQGESLSHTPSMSEFFVDEESYYDYSEMPVQRYFEVENLIDQYRYGYEVESYDGGYPNKKDELINYRHYYNPVWEVIETTDADSENNDSDSTMIVRQAVRGKWKRLKNKFITEYTDKNRLKITFGAGIRNEYGEIPSNANEFTQYMMSRMYANDYMGALPETGTTIYVLYRIGGGEMSNIAENTLTNITSLMYNIDGNCNDIQDANKKRAVKDSITVTNPSVSYGGKDAPSADEIRNLIKYNNGAQNRCVTLNDYYAMLTKIPAKYGLPFRMGVIEENNKIAIYSLGLDNNGKLTSILSETVVENMKSYLSKYKMVNDFVEIKSGKIINIGVTVTVYVDKSYDKAEVVQRVINKIYDYMDVRRHQMGEDIYLGDLQKEITKLDGVIQFVSMTCRNITSDGYSEDITTQEVIAEDDPCNDDYNDGSIETSNLIDLKASDYILFSEANAMHEIKYKEKDITVITKVR
jgi:hypothetical protein